MPSSLSYSLPRNRKLDLFPLEDTKIEVINAVRQVFKVDTNLTAHFISGKGEEMAFHENSDDVAFIGIEFSEPFDVANLMSNMNSLTKKVEKLERRNNQLYVRCLIEHGRLAAWKHYGEQFRSSYSQDCKVVRIYDESEDKWKKELRPESWTQFISFVVNVLKQPLPGSVELKGGHGSWFKDISSDVHSASMNEIRGALIHENDAEINSIFEYVFGEKVQ